MNEEDQNHESEDLAFITELRRALIEIGSIDEIDDRPTPDVLLQSIVRAAARAIPCPEAALFLVDHERGVLTFDVVIGRTAAQVRDIAVPLGHGIAGLVASSGQAIAVANAQEDPRHARDVAEQSGYLPTTILAVPVTARTGSTIGVLELLDRQDQQTFSLSDMELLGIFAEQVAMVLELRQSAAQTGVRIARIMADLSGIPEDSRRRIIERAQVFEERIGDDETFRRTSELAGLVVSLASRGHAEHALAMEVLTAVSTYVESSSTMRLEMFR